MKWILNIYPERQLSVTRFTGTIGYQDALDWLYEAVQHESFSKEYDGIVDLREVVIKDPSLEKVKLLGSYMTEGNFTRGKWAFLVNTPTETAISLLYRKIVAQQHHIEIFSTVEATASFLGKNLEGIDLHEA